MVSGGSSSWSVTTNQLSDGNQSLYYTYTPVGGRESDKSAILSGFKIDQTAPLLHNSPGTKMPDQSLTSMTVGTADTILVQLNISDPGDSGVAGIRAFFKN